MADLNADKKVSADEFTTFIETLLKRALVVFSVFVCVFDCCLLIAC